MQKAVGTLQNDSPVTAHHFVTMSKPHLLQTALHRELSLPRDLPEGRWAALERVWVALGITDTLGLSTGTANHPLMNTWWLWERPRGHTCTRHPPSRLCEKGK